MSVTLGTHIVASVGIHGEGRMTKDMDYLGRERRCGRRSRVVNGLCVISKGREEEIYWPCFVTLAGADSDERGERRPASAWRRGEMNVLFVRRRFTRLLGGGKWLMANDQ